MKIYISMLFFCIAVFYQAQEHDHNHDEDHDHSTHQTAEKLEGYVFYTLNDTNIPLSNIPVFWEEMPGMKAITDENGYFELAYHEGLFHIVIEKEGFVSQTLHIHDLDTQRIALELEEFANTEEGDLDAIIVRQRLKALEVDSKSVNLSFNINKDELLKAACCNLSESFETNPTVDVSYNDAVTGTKELILLGLNQKYTAFSRENLPEFTGLATYDGLEFIPGRWINSLQLAKGTNSATMGYDAVTGQINTELISYKEEPETQINLFASNNARLEGNIVTTQKLTEKLTNTSFLHGSARVSAIDSNDDHFLDSPKTQQINLMNILKYNDLEVSGFASQLGIQLINNQLTAGDVRYNSQNDRGTNNFYGVENETKRVQVWNKLGKVFKSHPGRSIGFLNQFTYHNQEQFFGTKQLSGKEITYFSKLLYEDIFSNTNHKYKVGASFLYDDFTEEYAQIPFERTERDLGLFAEYEYNYPEKFQALIGARVDFHNLAGTQFLPKVHLKYNFSKKTTLRASAGKSFRTANILEENQRYLVSQRELIIIPTQNGDIYGLQPETAWNYGLSFNQEFNLFSEKANFMLDYFITDFENQVIADVDTHSRQLLLYNLEGNSTYNSLQASLNFSLMKNLEARMAYKYYTTSVDYISGNEEVPYLPKHRGFLNLGYKIEGYEGKKWTFDATLQYVGSMRLPNTKNNPVAFQLADYTDSFMTLNAQISRDFSEHFRVYFGAENITSYQQDNPIMNVENPFNDYFDASFVYAPIMPISVYIGLDLSF